MHEGEITEELKGEEITVPNIVKASFEDTKHQKMSEEKGRNKNENQTGGRTGRDYKKEYSFL